MTLARLSRGWRWIWAALIAGALAAAGLAAAPARGATEVLYVPATGHYVRGVFRDYWDRNGGLANFGWPITEEYIDPASGKVYQYFERARFERDRPSSTTVQLGLLGREVAAGRVFPTSAPIQNTATRRYFPETSQIVQYGFKTIWETRGGLPIFGLPLSGEIEEQLEDGVTRTVQYFERARFEFHPDRPDGQRVLLSLLGRRLAPADRTAPLAPDAPPPPLMDAAPPTQPAPPPPPAGSPGGPGLVRPVVPEAVNAIVYPVAGQRGQVFLFTARGFIAGEPVALWASSPDGQTIAPDFDRVTADSDGTIDSSELFFASDANTALGVWSLVAQGVDSGRTAVGYFLVVGSTINRLPEPAPTPTPGPGVPANVDARADPRAGPAGTIFFFDARGFRAGEPVDVTITASDGRQTKASFNLTADAGGAIGYAGVYYVSAPDAPLGLYRMDAVGRESGKTSTAYFVLTP